MEDIRETLITKVDMLNSGCEFDFMDALNKLIDTYLINISDGFGEVDYPEGSTYYDLILENEEPQSMAQIAKDYGLSGAGFTNLLRSFGVTFSELGIKFLHRDYLTSDYVERKSCYYIDIDDSNITKTYWSWTQKGRLYLYDFLKMHDVLPLIER